MTTSLGSDMEGYRRLLDEVFDDTIVGWTADAEASERFPPRKLIEHLALAGCFAASGGPAGGQHPPDVAKLNELAFSLGRLGSAGIGGRRQPSRLGDRPATAIRQIRSPQDDLRAGHRR